MTTPLRRLLPIVWGVGCILGFAEPGDEYGLFALGSILGVWVALLFPAAGSPANLLLPVLVAGCGLMYCFGLVLDRLQGRRMVWLGAWLATAVVGAVWLLLGHASFAAALAKNGSLLAYLACASQLGTYVATLATGIWAGIARYFALWKADLAARG